MTTTTIAPPRETDAPAAPPASAASPAGRVRLVMRARFWVLRYGPAELACLITMLAASVVAARLTDSPPLLAGAAILGATVGFYGVLLAAVMREQLGLLPHGPRRARRAFVRSVGLLGAEFGVAELVDTFFLRPALMIIGVVVLRDAVWGLLAGKIVADVLFYVISGVSFRVTERTGIRLPRFRPTARLQPDGETAGEPRTLDVQMQSRGE